MVTDLGTVDLDCQRCGTTLLVPILTVDSAGTVHIDHDYLAVHAATHNQDNDGMGQQ